MLRIAGKSAQLPAGCLQRGLIRPVLPGGKKRDKQFS